MLTPEQQAQALSLRPLAMQIAHTIKDDEAEGVADLALCHAVHDYKPEGGASLRDYVWLRVSNALKDWRKRDRFERRIGTAGGAPSREQIEQQSGQGRRVRKTQDELAAGNSRALEEAIAAKDNPLPRLVPLLPKRLQPVARARWLDYLTIREVAEALGLSRSEVQRQCQEAEGFARVFMAGGFP